MSKPKVKVDIHIFFIAFKGYVDFDVFEGLEKKKMHSECTTFAIFTQLLKQSYFITK